MNSLKVRKTRNGQIIAWADGEKAYITARFFARLKAYYWEHGYRNFMLV